MVDEFKSELEKTAPAIELDFNPTPAFGKYKNFLEHAVAHPAKMNTKLLEFLILNFTEEGETVLDPMAGSGSTGVVAALHGRNAVQVEIEEKFYKWMEKARENVEKTHTLAPKGKIVNILGDARKLSSLLKQQADSIVTSPPYSDISKPANIKKPISKEEYERRKSEGDHSVYHDTRPERKGTLYEYYEIIPIEKYGSQNNIDQLPHGDIDAIITSPPYSESKKGEIDDETAKKIAEKKTTRYNSGDFTTPGRILGLKALQSGYSKSKDNIGNLPLGNIDIIITSPPYEASLEGTTRHTRGGIASRDSAIAQTGSYTTIMSPETSFCYSPNPDNIGNLKSSDEEYKMLENDKLKPLSDEEVETLAKQLLRNGKPTYLSEMLKVYREMYKVLKPDGKAIIIVKPFIRNKKVVDLPLHTYLLLKYAGFKLEKLYKLRLKNRSFWRILYYRRHKNVPMLNHEYILVMRKN